MVRMRVHASDRDTAVDLTITGRFELTADADELATHRLVEYNAPAILYGLVRGIVGAVSSLSGRERIDLPSVNLARLIDG
ncbi:MAG: hypothetical protein M9925_10995 [Chloroflexi bacterium]|nr:hypothetical protein [Chloroflexota bacterium]